MSLSGVKLRVSPSFFSISDLLCGFYNCLGVHLGIATHVVITLGLSHVPKSVPSGPSWSKPTLAASDEPLFQYAFSFSVLGPPTLKRVAFDRPHKNAWKLSPFAFEYLNASANDFKLAKSCQKF